MNYPPGYAWLGGLGVLPKVIAEGLMLVGTLETPGAADNPVILGWAREVGKDVAAVYGHDAVPWCGLFAAVVCQRADKPVIAGPLWAANWAKFGVKSPLAGLGDVLVFKRDGGGHVGFYVAEDDSAYHVLGGNQGDRVSIARVAKARCVAVRRPVFAIKAPASVKPYHVAANGALSGNEA